MVRNYLKIAWRNLWNNKLFSFINIISLAIGFSASFVIGLIVYYDLTFDKFHADEDRIYRVTTEYTSPESTSYNPGVAIPLGTTLKEGTPGIETVTTFFTSDPQKVKSELSDHVYNLYNVVYADANYFKLFHYKWLAGSAENALTEPNQVVLTQKRAAAYFPNLTPKQTVGKTLTYQDSILVSVTGVVENFKKRSDLIFEEFISLKTAAHTDMDYTVNNDQWSNTNSASQLFIKIEKNTSLASIQQQLDKLAKDHQDKESASRGHFQNFSLQPLADLHFNANYGIFDSSIRQANKSILIGLACIAGFLLLLGCINFINLNTAQATQRAKEIGIRKTLGSSKKQLVFQFLGETFILTVFAAALSILLSIGLLKAFADFIPPNLNMGLMNNPAILLFVTILILLVTLFSGIYPALVLSHFKPAAVLKNQVVTSNGKGSLRQFLTVFQFSIAQIFIIATLLVGKQIHFLMNKDMGFKSKAIAYVRTPWRDWSKDKHTLFMEKAKAIPQIKELSLGGAPPASFSTHSSTTTFYAEGKEIHTDLEFLYGDTNYLDLYNLKLLAGRNIRNDTVREYVINESYMKLLGFENPDDVIGQTLSRDEETIPIVGVMKDFYQRSLKSKIQPMALVGDWSRSGYSQLNTLHFSLKTEESGSWPAAIAQLENAWKTIYPEEDFEVHYIDKTVEKFYDNERKTATLLNWATGLSVLISCLGLLGLVIHTTQRRTKEIGIRKVLGASLAQLNLLLCSDFLKLVGIAFIIAAPIAWWGLHNWLEDFAYRTSLSWWVFLLSGLGMLLIALLIMSIKTIATAMENPVKSLRNE